LQLNTNIRAASSSAVANGTAGSAISTPAECGLDGLNLGAPKDSRSGTPAIPFASSADTTILPIVTNQRDRFRQRNAELEEELRKQFDIISDLRNDIKSLQQDNLKLYEKVRYMQSYRTGEANATGPSSIAASFVPGPHNAIPNIPKSDESMNRYKNMYEERMNPFEAFRGREQVRAVQALNPVERGVFLLTRQILGNRRTRIAFAIYAGVLHLLVLVTLYECSSFGRGGGMRVSNPPSNAWS